MIRPHWTISLLLATTLLCFGAAVVEAGPVTNSGTPGAWPYVKLGIYQGVAALSVNGSSVLELGANGRDIAVSSNSALVVRPNGVDADHGARFSSVSGSTRLQVPGRVCLYPSGISNPASCYDRWPTGGTPLWESSTDADGFTTLTPIPNGSSQQGVKLGSSSTPITGGSALAIQQTPTGYLVDALRATNLSSSGIAFESHGDVGVDGYLHIGGSWSINGNEVYYPAYSSGHPAHEGLGSGLDADFLDGYNVVLSPGSRCNAMACLCFVLSASNTKCAALTNRY